MGVMSTIANALGFGNADQVNDAKKAIAQNRGLWQNNYNENQDTLNKYLDTISQAHDDTLKSQYNQAKTDYANIGTYDPSKFQYGKSVEDFMSPAMDMRIKAASDAITNSQANARKYVQFRLSKRIKRKITSYGK
ncbi:MAG: hypothetical protein J5588_02895 [Bacteroidales bacterium]|jgi:response regulator of citrate/malate metabolism|uniref:hypothetical protein n=1 Tax=Fibrobacter sp. TaxID=35828 RepID=UPI001B21B695|nr:hypothetical protein [Fibrobacter sp.]MBO4777417.1 hypothetical protein [Bacteroidales bacterium]MBO7060541.1 hypothetical protein [Fibrobacter sp.]